MSISSNEILARRRRISEELKTALSELGLSQKEFAAEMNRHPSEVTRWLSGNHNFTSDLLEEMSMVLGRPISGAADSLQATSEIVDGYSKCHDKSDSLDEPHPYAVISIPAETAELLAQKSKSKGMTLREYIVDILKKDSESKSPSAFDFCGIWSEDYPDAAELRSLRTGNTIHEI